jgi:hypothetical protein
LGTCREHQNPKKVEPSAPQRKNSGPSLSAYQAFSFNVFLQNIFLQPGKKEKEQMVFCFWGKKEPKSPHYEENGSKSPFLDNRNQQAADLLEVSNFLFFSFLSPSDL